MAASRSNHRAAIVAVQERRDLPAADKQVQVRAIKSAAFKAVFPQKLTFETRRGTATVTDFRERAGGFECRIVIPDVPLDNPFVFINPPLLVADDDGDVEVLTPATEIAPEERRKYREDPEAALVLIVAAAVR